eukprot:6469090-Amphidinium_carterae.1
MQDGQALLRRPESYQSIEAAERPPSPWQPQMSGFVIHPASRLHLCCEISSQNQRDCCCDVQSTGEH